MKLSNMAVVLRRAGLTVTETPGWASRGYKPDNSPPLDLRQVRGVLWHHTATGRDAYIHANAPTLGLCINGRAGLAGPLCHILLGRDGTVYLVAAGLANHAGEGSAPGIPEDEGNYYLIGIEMESSGVTPWDWTADQVRTAPALGAALEQAYLAWLPEDERLQLGHKEYSTAGKIDPAGWPGDMDGLRAAINKAIAAGGAITPQGDTTGDGGILDMDEKQLRAIVREEAGKGTWGFSGKLPTEKNQQTMWNRSVMGSAAAVRAEAKLAALTAAVEKLADGAGVDGPALLSHIDAAVDGAVADIKTVIESGVLDVDVTLNAGAKP